MSEEPQMLRMIDWRSVFPFTHLFRAFRIAIHPAKLALALLAIILVYGAGRTMDALWPTSHRAVPEQRVESDWEAAGAGQPALAFDWFTGELALYEVAPDRAAFKSAVAEVRQRLTAERDQVARRVALDTKKEGESAADPKALSDRDVKRLIKQRRDNAVNAVNDAYNAESKKDADARKVRDDAIRDAYGEAAVLLAKVERVSGEGLGFTLIRYEARQVDAIAQAVLNWDWHGPAGVLASLKRLVFTGPGWAFFAHPCYFTLFTAVALLVWSVIGGAIARIAAVHVSQDEKISVRQALRFSLNKLMSFVAAPVIPLLLVGAILLILALLGWLSEIAFVGGLTAIVVGIAFVLLILAGVLLACTVIGWVGGFGMMYPTIAVEGSDAFDAVSRSFSYVFARPWKVAFYGVVALVYGAITYLFLRLVVFLTLCLLHGSLTAWTSQTTPAGKTSIASAWYGPGGLFDLTTPQPDGFSLTFAQSVGSGFLMFWVYLFVSLLGAYVLSFFVSANTIMYYLLRYEVDATEIDDVYLEPNEDDDAFDDGSSEPPAQPIVSPPQPIVSPPAVDPLPSAAPPPTATTPGNAHEAQLPPPTPPPAGS